MNGDSNYIKQHTCNVRCIQPYCLDENFEPILGKVDYYHDSYFVEKIDDKEVVGKFQPTENISKMEKKSKKNYLEGMKWCDVQQGDVHKMIFSAKHLSVQLGLKEYKEAGKIL